MTPNATEPSAEKGHRTPQLEAIQAKTKSGPLTHNEVDANEAQPKETLPPAAGGEPAAGGCTDTGRTPFG